MKRPLMIGAGLASVAVLAFLALGEEPADEVAATEMGGAAAAARAPTTPVTTPEQWQERRSRAVQDTVARAAKSLAEGAEQMRARGASEEEIALLDAKRRELEGTLKR